MRAAALRSSLPVAGLVIAAYGLLVLLGVIAHEATWVGWTALAAGTTATLAAAATSLGRREATAARPAHEDGRPAGDAARRVADGPPAALRRRIVLLLGTTCSIGAVAYNVATRSSLAAAEWAILGYGLALLAVAGRLEKPVHPRRRLTYGDAVGWSFALVLAPLALYALNGILSRAAAATAAQPAVTALVVAPTAWTLQLLGTDLAREGSSLVLGTPRGVLVLGVGLVCAGLYPMVLFGGLLGVHAWRERLGWRRAATLAAVGLTGLWLVNLVRLLLLVHVGIAYGPAALDAAHANAGWLLFAAYMVLFWWWVHRRDARRRAAQRPPGNVPG